MDTKNSFSSIDVIREQLTRHRYISDQSLATVLYLSYHLNKPIFLEGEPGVGKTEVALVLANILSTKLIRLQCYEGLDANSALYEWNYPKQLLRIKMDEQCGLSAEEMGQAIYSEPYLIKRPLLEAIQSSQGNTPVLLIDELDRADEEFEAFLLEILSDFQVSIPEIGTLKATRKPMVVITSNRTRNIHDALKRLLCSKIRFGRSGMVDLIPRIQEIWQTRKEEVLSSADQIVSTLQQTQKAQ